MGKKVGYIINKLTQNSLHIYVLLVTVTNIKVDQIDFHSMLLLPTHFQRGADYERAEHVNQCCTIVYQ